MSGLTIKNKLLNGRGVAATLLIVCLPVLALCLIQHPQAAAASNSLTEKSATGTRPAAEQSSSVPAAPSESTPAGPGQINPRSTTETASTTVIDKTSPADSGQNTASTSITATSSSNTAPSLEQSGTSGSVSAASTTPAPAAANVETVEQGDGGGQLPVRFSLLFQSIYDDNIYIRNHDVVGDFYCLINPGITYETSSGDDQPEHFLRAWYKPKILRFLDETKNNSFDQDLYFQYKADLGHLRLGVSQTYLTDSSPSADAGGRLDTEHLDTNLYAHYDLTGRLTWENELTQKLTRYQVFNSVDSNEWTASSYLNYAAFPKTNIALGGTAGYLVLYRNPDQYYEQARVRLTYQATSKIILNASAGAEYRQYEHSQQTTLSPIYTLGGEYYPSDSTVIKIEGEGKTTPSINRGNQDYASYGVNLSTRQRFFQHYYLGLNTGYYHSIYYNVPSGRTTGLEYDYFSVRPALDWELNNYFTFGVYYQHQENIGSQNDTSYLSNQCGIQGSFKY